MVTGIQETYELDLNQYREGQLIRALQTQSVILDADTPVGVAVAFDPSNPGFGDTPIALRTDATGEVNEPLRIGIVLLDESAQQDDAGDFSYEAGATVTTLVRGRMVVQTEDSLAVGVRPFIRHVATPPEELGAFRSDADAGDATVTTNIRTVTPSQTIDAIELVVIDIGG